MQQLLQSVKLERLDADLFRSISLWTPNTGRGTFGGQLVAHSYEAAHNTVEKDLHVHSLHGHFLQAGNSKRPMYYRVRMVRTGTSFATRIVTATQDGNAVYTATVSFHRREPAGISHAPRMPQVPPPEECIGENFLVVRGHKTGTEKVKENLARKSAQLLPFELRYVIPEVLLSSPTFNPLTLMEHARPGEKLNQGKAARSASPSTEVSKPVAGKGNAERSSVAPSATSSASKRPMSAGSPSQKGKTMSPPQLSPPAVPPPPASDTESDPGRSEPQIDEATYTWQRAQYDGDDSHTHKLIAAFLSDFSLLFSAFAPHMHHRAVKELRMIASLDHAIYFHAPIRVDEWCLYEMRSTWAGGSRALSFGRIYNHEGVLAMSTVQEGLIRTSPNFESTVTINSKL